MATGPDQGFAWVIALACFFINFIMAGVARSAGIMYVAVINSFAVSREAAIVPFSIRTGVRNMTGPLIGYLGQKYGIQRVTTAGGLVAALGGIICYFAPNVLWITVFWGVLHGFGFGLATVLHMLAISQYFHKYKASAMGLGYSGDCCGSFTFPLILDYLYSKYDVRDTFLILGGIMLNVIPMGLLLREPHWIKYNKPEIIDGIDNKGHTDLSEENHLNCSKKDENMECKTKTDDLRPIETINDRSRKETDVFENISKAKKFLCFKSHLIGEYNKAFQVSETDLHFLDEEREVSNLTIKNLGKECYNQKINSSASQLSDLLDSSNKKSSSINSSTSNINDKTLQRECDNITFLETRASHSLGHHISRSVSDLNQRNELHLSVNRSLLLSSEYNAASLCRRSSMTPAIEREIDVNEKSEISTSFENTRTEYEVSHYTGYSNAGKLEKPRTSSFIVQDSQDNGDKIDTGSSTNHVVQDVLAIPIPNENKLESEWKSECELKTIADRIDPTENKDCQSITFYVDKNTSKDNSRGILNESESAAEEKSKKLSILKIMLHTNIKPMFILISLSRAAHALLFVSVLTIIIDYAVDLSIPNEQGKYLLISFSVGDLIGRLSFGQVLDRKLMKVKDYAGYTMLVTGAVVSAIPLDSSFSYIITCMCVCGFIQGGTAIMHPILINTYMDKGSESIAMGCLNFYAGLLLFLMSPMIGFFRDNIGSYRCVFYIIGGVAAAVGIIWQFEPLIIKYQNRKRRK